MQPCPSLLVQRLTLLSAANSRSPATGSGRGSGRGYASAMAAARATGISEMCGEVLASNHKMLQLTARFGFRARFGEAIRA